MIVCRVLLADEIDNNCSFMDIFWLLLALQKILVLDELGASTLIDISIVFGSLTIDGHFCPYFRAESRFFVTVETALHAVFGVDGL